MTEKQWIASDGASAPRSLKDRTLHMIGNAHIDPVWLWQWPEGCQEVLATFRSALDRMNEHPDFCFTASSAAFYEWVEQTDPAMFDEIRARVAEGRWEIVGGWWIEPDCHVPAGESFVRQGLYGQRYFREKLGTTARVGYNVDSFGHNGSLPQILKKSGLDAYVFMRPSPHEKGLPGRLFWWEAADGSRVLTFRIPYEYCSWPQDLETHVRRCTAEIKRPMDELMCFYGVGNHGGGPTVENIASIRHLDRLPELPHLPFSTIGRFFDHARAGLARGTQPWSIPVVHDDLRHHASGCYAAHSGIKQWNRRAENALLRAEKWAAIAGRVTGQPYPADLAQAWKGVLFNQFHDILAGTAVEAAYDDARDLYGEAMSIAGRALNAAVQSLAWNVHMPYDEGARPILVLNPHAWAAKMPVELEVGGLKEGDGLVDDRGRPVPVQRVQSQATAGGRQRLAFVADLPPLGYRVYRLRHGGPEVADTPLHADETHLENDRFRLTFDPATGYLSSLYDKQAEVEVLAGPAARPVVLDDPSDTWGHNVFRFGPAVGTFAVTGMRVVEHGPVKAVLRVSSTYGASTLAQDFTLYRDLERVDVRVTVDWHERQKMLKLRFPVSVKFMKVTHEIPYGYAERFANGEEEPCQSWVDISGMSRDRDVPYGLSLLDDAKYSVDVDVRDIGLTVLRSPIYAHHMPVEPDPARDYVVTDQGRQQFTYSLLPHSGSWEQAGTVRQAAELNQPAVALPVTFRPQGTLPQAGSFLSVDDDNVVVTVLKQAEDGGDLVVRAYESTGNATRTIVRLPAFGRTFEADFGACEIKTWRLPSDPARPVVETDLLEDALPESMAAGQPAARLSTLPGRKNGNVHAPRPLETPAHGSGPVRALMEGAARRAPAVAACGGDLWRAFELLRDAFRAGNKLLVCGNGGSAADSEHIVGELMKAFNRRRTLPAAERARLAALFDGDGDYLAGHLQGALPALSLASQGALLTATANDVAADVGFAQQVYGYGREGDALLAISTSGSSKNVLHALRVARARGLRTVGLTGPAGGALPALCDVAIRAPGDTVAEVQQAHQAIYHALCDMLEAEFFCEEAL